MTDSQKARIRVCKEAGLHVDAKTVPFRLLKSVCELLRAANRERGGDEAGGGGEGSHGGGSESSGKP